MAATRTAAAQTSTAAPLRILLPNPNSSPDFTYPWDSHRTSCTTGPAGKFKDAILQKLILEIASAGPIPLAS